MSIGVRVERFRVQAFTGISGHLTGTRSGPPPAAFLPSRHTLFDVSQVIASKSLCLDVRIWGSFGVLAGYLHALCLAFT